MGPLTVIFLSCFGAAPPFFFFSFFVSPNRVDLPLRNTGHTAIWGCFDRWRFGYLLHDRIITAPDFSSCPLCVCDFFSFFLAAGQVLSALSWRKSEESRPVLLCYWGAPTPVQLSAAAAANSSCPSTTVDLIYLIESILRAVRSNWEKHSNEPSVPLLHHPKKEMEHTAGRPADPGPQQSRIAFVHT
jgi:hypothetical protein